MEKLKKVLLWYLTGFFCLASLLLVVADSNPEPNEGTGQLNRELLFYVSFDETITPEISRGNSKPAIKKEWVFEKGKKGKAIKIGGAKGSPPVAYFTEGNIDSQKGTIAFWIKPYDLWDNYDYKDSQKDHRCTLFFISPGLNADPVFWCCWYNKEDAVFFSSLYKTEEGGYAWIWEPRASVSHWKSEEWYHVVFTWRNGEKKIYINGDISGKWEGRFLERYLPGSVFCIGSRSDNKTEIVDADIDELMIWGRMLSDSEIKMLYNEEMTLQTNNLSGNDNKVIKKLEISLAGTNAPDFLFYEGEDVVITTPIQNMIEKEQKINIKYQVFDYYQDLVQELNKELIIPSKFILKDKITLLPKKRGLFKVVLNYQTEDGTKGKKDIVIFGVVPNRPWDTPASSLESSFGIHTRTIPMHLGISNKIGAQWIRMVDLSLITWWSEIEPEKGQFRWFDIEADLVSKSGLNILGVFFSTPYWASSSPPGFTKDDYYIYRKYPPKDIKDFERYIMETVNHYKDRIKYWEFWNEPDISVFWTGTPEEYVEFLKVTYITAKKVDPECKILGGGGLPLATLKWLERVFAAGGLNYMDILSFHGYGEGGYVALDIPTHSNPTFTKHVAELRRIMKKYGKELPIWNTETTIFGQTNFSDLELPEFPPPSERFIPYDYQHATNEVVKLYVSNFAEGIDKVFYYYMESVTVPATAYCHQSLLEYNGAPTSKAMAHLTTAYILDGAKFEEKINIKDLMDCYIFKKGNQSIGVVWGMFKDKEKVKIEIPIESKEIKVIDIMGNEKVGLGKVEGLCLEISSEPVFIVGKDLHIEEFRSSFKLAKVTASNELLMAQKHEVREDETTSIVDIKDFEEAKNIEKNLWFQIDISTYTNMGFKDDVAGDGKGGWSDEGPMNDMKDMPVGIQFLAGVPFEIIDPSKNNNRSCIVLRSPMHGPYFPKEIRRIEVNRALTSIYFLHSAAWCGITVGTKSFAKYVLNYIDGTKEEIDLKGKYNILDWWDEPTDKEISKVVPIKISDNLGKDTRYLRVFRWLNTQPLKKISSIDFISMEEDAMPILIAITGVSLSSQQRD